MSNINLIIITELNKAEQMLADRKISVKDNLGKLVKSGAIRSRDKIIHGIEKGNTNLKEKNNVKEYTMDSKEGSASSTLRQHDNLNSQNEIRVPHFNPYKKYLKSDAGKIVISRRHENDEIDTGEKYIKKYNETPMGYNFNISNPNSKIKTGRHISPEVLKREKKNTSYLSLFDKNVNNFRKDRIESGEYGPKAADLSSRKIRKIMKNNISFNKYKDTSNELDKMINNNPTYQHYKSRQKLASKLNINAIFDKKIPQEKKQFYNKSFNYYSKKLSNVSDNLRKNLMPSFHSKYTINL